MGVSVGVATPLRVRHHRTPLMLACTKDSLDVVQSLVGGGAGLLLVNKDGWTPLHIACRHGNTNIVRFLLDTDPQCGNTVSKNGRTPLHTAGSTEQDKPHPLMLSFLA